MKYILLYVGLAAVVSSVVSQSIIAREQDVTYYFYNRSNPNGIQVTTQDVDDIAHISTVFNPALRTFVLIHGWKDGYEADSNTYISQAILSSFDANIITVDWSINAGRLYILALLAVPSVGRYTGQFIEKIAEEFSYSLGQVTLIGFSLGAHVAGNVGKYFNGALPLIIGLDPAGPLISSQDTSYSLDPTDALYVQVIHTDAGSAGMANPVGHSDFYPNDGKNQPGCSATGCSHNRAWVFYTESITNNQFVGQRCNTYQSYTSHSCSGTYALMGGVNVDTSVTGIYYLTTNAQSPYGRGQE